MTLKRLPMCAEMINSSFKDYSLLDIGCRTMALKPLLQSCHSYTGTDIVPGEGILEGNLEEGIKAEDKSYDVVVALDVLEHLDKAHFVLQEILRVAKKGAIISLPNMYFWSFRFNFLRGKGLSGKYKFPPHAILDRHRWVLSYDEAVAYIKAGAPQDKYDIRIEPILPERGRSKLVMEPLEKFLSKIWPNAYIYGVLFQITPKTTKE